MTGERQRACNSPALVARWGQLLLATAMLAGSVHDTLAAEPPPGRTVEFNRDVRPILSDKCYRCHGPDSGSREANLRLDVREAALADRDGTPVIVAGDASQGELLARVTSHDADVRMPPPATGKTLTPAEIETLRLWIQQGAAYQAHWSFVPPVRPKPPIVAADARIHNPIDAFVIHRLKQRGQMPAPEANPATLLRRLTLDLTGLPPTLSELEAFVTDERPDAYAQAVERLLASPRYGERMALSWLDAARYADTNGYFGDDERVMWHWRDWVIRAYNQNMPFDRFTVEQLAGDLLPNPTREQLIATGFNRNHMVNNETGIVEEEYRVEYVVDRISTTGTVWMGLTIGCARCHDHKFDPLSQREFYELFAFFNNGPERGLSGSQGNSAPTINVPTEEWQAKREELRQQTAAAQQRLQDIEPQLAAAQTAWEKSAVEELPAPVQEGLVAHYEFEGNGHDSSGNQFDGNPEGQVEFAKGLLGQAAKLDGDSLLTAQGEWPIDSDTPFSFGAWIYVTDGRPACVISKNDDTNSLRGLDLMIRKGRAAVHLIHRWNTNAIQVVTKDPVTRNRWQHVLVTYDGSSQAAGVAIYLDGRPASLDIVYDSLTGSIRTSQPLRIGRRSTSAPFVGSIDDVRLYDRQLAPAEIHQLAENQFLRGVLSEPGDKRTATAKQTLRELFITEYANSDWRTIWREAQEQARLERRHASQSPTAMVMQEMEQPRETFVLERGLYNLNGDKVTPNVPRSLPPLPTAGRSNRLSLANWLVDPAHPLTARVAVNRLWQIYFGEGIVKSVGDFGSQGDLPSHPELLDWLAVEFVESGWDLKHMARLIVTSATYRQSSQISAELAQLDPENRWLARGPRFRLSAELLRDNALAISGLLVERQGGPSVKPYQPAGLWKAVTYDGNLEYTPDTGAKQYRRSLYTYWKRQSPPPALLAFDAPTRESCVVQRSRTNTPLQALVLMNDPTYVEAARKLAERALRETSSDEPADHVRHAFRLATSREPTSTETSTLLDVLAAQGEEFRKDSNAARQLLSVGESPVDPAFATDELAALTTITGMILCLDETLTKE